jgi:diaminopimelate epimerase
VAAGDREPSGRALVPPAPGPLPTLVAVDITKAHGTGNDFVVIADLDDRIALDEGFVRALCDRRTGVGADGVLRIGPGSDGADVFMDHRNADGSTASMCGNGVRVVAQHVIDHGLVPDRADGTVRVGTRAGVREVVVHRGADGRVASATVDMGPATSVPVQVPFVPPVDDGRSVHTLEVDGHGPIELAVVSMGNPHAVVVVDDVAEAPVTDLGARLEVDEHFPQRVNVGFAQVVDRGHVRLRVFERGVGETAACGTGACAAAAALADRGLVDDAVEVALPGGVLHVRRAEDGHLHMTGAVVEVARGRLDPAWLAQVRPS